VLQQQIGAAREQRRFLAFDMRLRRWCTVHLPKARYLDEPSRLERFVRRAEGLAAVDHPRVLRVLDLDTDGRLPYVVTELARGGTLSTWLRRNTRMPPRMAAQVLGQVVEGIAAIHAAGGVHGTLEPKRICIRADGTVAVTDLGVTDSSDDPAFRAPETRHTPRRTHGPAADLYALGALLYTLVTGLTPEDLFYAEAYEGMLAAVPIPLQPVVLRACAIEPGDRYSDAAELGRALAARASRLPPDDPGPMLIGALPALGDGPQPTVQFDHGLLEVQAVLGTPRGTPVRLEIEPITTLSDDYSEDSVPSLPYVMPNPDRIDPGFRDPFEQLSEDDVPAYVAPEGVEAWKRQVIPSQSRVVVQSDGTLEDRPEPVELADAPRSLWKIGGALGSIVLLGGAALLALTLVVGAATSRVWLVQSQVESAAQGLQVELSLSQSVLTTLVERGADSQALGEAWGAMDDGATADEKGRAAVRLVTLAESEAERLGVEVAELERWRAAVRRWDAAQQARDEARDGVLGWMPGWTD
jgi:serine/threonine-protein kinase